jgi:hypothetical protein
MSPAADVPGGMHLPGLHSLSQLLMHCGSGHMQAGAMAACHQGSPEPPPGPQHTAQTPHQAPCSAATAHKAPGGSLQGRTGTQAVSGCVSQLQGPRWPEPPAGVHACNSSPLQALGTALYVSHGGSCIRCARTARYQLRCCQVLPCHVSLVLLLQHRLASADQCREPGHQHLGIKASLSAGRPAADRGSACTCSATGRCYCHRLRSARAPDPYLLASPCGHPLPCLCRGAWSGTPAGKVDRAGQQGTEGHQEQMCTTPCTQFQAYACSIHVSCQGRTAVARVMSWPVCVHGCMAS